MNTISPTEDDAKLSTLLHEWELEIDLPPRFQERVWRRIECAAAPSKVRLWHAFTQWVESRFNRPALALCYVAVMLFVAIGTGYLQARATSARAEARWRTAYVQSVDPYQVPRN